MHCIAALLITVAMIDPLTGQVDEEHFAALSAQLTAYINKERVERDAPALQMDTGLYKAAMNQAVYVARVQKLTHGQDRPDMDNVLKRVEHYNEDRFVQAGENILFTSYFTLPLNESKIKALALQMFEGWKNSPSHYKNMIQRAYTHHALAFYYNKKNKAIYATQVFAAMER